MDMLQAALLAVVQGLTEFLPISSSGHLILFPHLFGWQDQGLAFDVAVHVGTLAAVVWYFREQLKPMVADWLRSLVERRLVGESRLAWGILIGTIPVGLAGLAFQDEVETTLRSPLVIATTTVVFGLLLWWADARGRRQRSEHEFGWKDVLVIGGAQALALIPGMSRSGITMTAGLMQGLTREGAARFSFLLSIPVITLAGTYHGVELVRSAAPVQWSAMAVGVVTAAVSAYLCIHFFLKLLERVGMLPFVLYRLLLGSALFALYA